MVHAPPTPPPTTAGELQDEARAISSADASTSVVPPQTELRPDLFQLRFPMIADFAVKNNYKGLIQAAEELDLSAIGDRQPTRLLIVAPLVLAYLIEDDVAPAQFALTRMVDSLASLPLSKVLMDVVTSTMSRQHAKVYFQAEEVFNLVSEPAFFSKELGTVIASMVNAFIESFRHRTFTLLAKACDSLPISLAQVYLGLPADQIIEVAERDSWSYNPSTKILTTTANMKLAVAESFPSSAAFSSLSTFHFVADSAAKLEL